MRKQNIPNIPGFSSNVISTICRYITEKYPVILNVVYCKRVVTTSECPAPDRPGIWSCYWYIRVASMVAFLPHRCTMK